ncbi:HD family phosphohydrolase [Euzebya tangerina]|uniref:HD family phosphohydrolase n=1 Tax=Euzebya tangerina TaxID=591198 RepID=UPI000E318E7A|nr:HDIG domain-containing metalloprotein [Euzebya tangerina]
MAEVAEVEEATEKGPRTWPLRIAALLLAILGLPSILGLAALFTEAPITLDEESPRTVIAPEELRVIDEEETELARRRAAEAVEPVVTENLTAQSDLIQFVVDAFAVAQSVRSPGVDGDIPSASQQIDGLSQRLPVLEEEALRLLVDLTDAALSTARSEAQSIARTAAATEILEGEVEDYANNQLQTELARSTVGPEVSRLILEPILREALRPTRTVNEQETISAREAAAEAVEPVEVPFRRGTAIVRSGEIVTPIQLQALREAGLDGSDPLIEFAQALLLSVVLALVVAVYLRTYRPGIWATGRSLLLLVTLMTLFTVIALVINTVGVGGSERHYLIPVGAIAMMATILFDARVGVLSVIPMTALVAYQIPGTPGLVPFAAVSGLLSIPLVGEVTARNQLRATAWQSTIAYMVLAAAFNVVYSGFEGLVPALIAGLGNGILTALMVNGLLPFLESLFGVITASSLLDFADRNHPLLRELEAKAIGTYNHSVMVATLASRACRAIEADALLAEVMALYHDIGKVAKPYFFVENQVAIGNPHDELDDPRQSALIIQRHVTDGVEMALVHKLPPEIVDGIRTHHGTTVVAYFYRQALARAEDGLAAEPDEAFFRYKGKKPFSREQAVLMLSDCCEGAVRAASSRDGGMSRDTISSIVTGLIGDRVADGQLDNSPLTFADLRAVEHSLIEGLEGVYHPRIQYPKDPRKAAGVAEEARKETEIEARAAEAADAKRAELKARTEPAGDQDDEHGDDVVEPLDRRRQGDGQDGTAGAA